MPPPDYGLHSIATFLHPPLANHHVARVYGPVMLCTLGSMVLQHAQHERKDVGAAWVLLPQVLLAMDGGGVGRGRVGEEEEEEGDHVRYQRVWWWC